MVKHRILLVDDHEVVRLGLRALLEHNPQFEVVGEAGNSKEALEQVELYRPDIVLMDIAMPVMNGVVATELLNSELPDFKVIAL